jgi:methionyl-tRNA synthetase
MLTSKLDGQLSRLNQLGKELINKLTAAKEQIVQDYESLNYAAVVRTISSLADEANRYVEQNQPWVTVKTDLEKTRITLTAIINAVHILTIYLKPILPKYAELMN